MSIPTPNWYRDVELRIMRIEDTVANLYTQVQSMDSEIMLLQTEIEEMKEPEEIPKPQEGNE